MQPRPRPSGRALAVSSTTTATGAARAAPIGRTTRWRQALIAWSFALPFLILFAVFMLVPIVAAAVTSFTDLTSRDIRNPLGVEFIGVENYVDVLADRKFHKAAGQYRGLRARRRSAGHRPRASSPRSA